jgi:hypothetical protein
VILYFLLIQDSDQSGDDLNSQVNMLLTEWKTISIHTKEGSKLNLHRSENDARGDAIFSFLSAFPNNFLMQIFFLEYLKKKIKTGETGKEMHAWNATYTKDCITLLRWIVSPICPFAPLSLLAPPFSK